jgi:hypothetical protein
MVQFIITAIASIVLAAIAFFIFVAFWVAVLSQVFGDYDPEKNHKAKGY